MQASAASRQKLIIAGGGLAAGLIALRLAGRADAEVLILEAGDKPFGAHTWSFHAADVSPAQGEWLAPLIAHRWPGQSVRFPGYTRRLATGYASLTSDSLRAGLAGLPGVTVRTGARVAGIDAGGVTLESGERLEAPCVIDARGFTPSAALALGYQKFVGLEVQTAAPHGLSEPVIMDATVAQHDGYRFVYLLPFAPDRILIEDTRYADGAAQDEAGIEQAIHDYAGSQGWTIARVLRRERGVLPITLAHDVARFWAERPRDVPQAGLRAALFHPTTGYSLPDAVRLADLVAEAWPVASAALAQRIRDHAMARQRAQGFYRLLNRMLFRAARPERRHLVMARFYRLGAPLIERFYAGETSVADMARILTGKPPVPLGKALGCLREAPFLSMEQA